MEKIEFGKEWQDEQREKMVRIQFPKTIKRIEDKAREEVIKNLIKKIEEANCDSISLEFLREIDLSKLTTK
jgi:hypothetical protein